MKIQGTMPETPVHGGPGNEGLTGIRKTVMENKEQER